MSKRILSFALVVVMLFSTFAITSSAAVADGYEVGLRVESDATVGMPKGSVVNVKVYYEVPEGKTLNLQFSGHIALAWNSTAYAVNSTQKVNVAEVRTFGSSYAETFKESAMCSLTAGNAVVKTFGDAEKANKWDKSVVVQLLQVSATSTYTTSTGYPVSDGDSEIFTMQFVTQKDSLEATDIIGIPMSAYGTSNLKVQTYDKASNTTTVIPVASVNVTNATPKATAAKADVYKLADPRKHVNADGTSTVAAFFAFDAATIAPDFVSGTSQFITGITATITATSGGQTITVTPDAIKYVYDINKDGTVYGFRVIMKNVPADAVITVVPAVATTDNATYTVDTLNINVASVTAY